MFHDLRGWKPVVASTPFLAILVGTLLGTAINLANEKYYRRRLLDNKGRAIPEARLPPMMVGGLLFAAGFFLFGWTSKPDVHWFP